MVVLLQELGDYAVLGNLSTFPMQTKRVFKWQAEAIYKQLTEKQKLLYDSVAYYKDSESVIRVYGDYLPERRRFDTLYMETNKGRVIDFHYSTYVDIDFYLTYMPKDIEDGSKLKLQCCDYLQVMNSSIGQFIMADPINDAVLVTGRYDSTQSRNGYNVMYNSGPFFNYNVNKEKLKCIVDRKSGFPMLFVLSNTGNWELASFKCNEHNTTLSNTAREMTSVQKQLSGSKRVLLAQNSSTESLIDALKCINFPTIETNNLNSMYTVAKEMGQHKSLGILMALYENEKWIARDNNDKSVVAYTFKRDIGAYLDVYQGEYKRFIDDLSIFGENKVLFKSTVVKDGVFYGVTRDTLTELKNKDVTVINLSDAQCLANRSLCCVHWRTSGTGAGGVTVCYGEFSEFDVYGMLVYRLNLATVKYSTLNFSAITLNSTTEKTVAGCKFTCECENLTEDFVSRLKKNIDNTGIECTLILSLEGMLRDGTLLQSMRILSEYYVQEYYEGFNWKLLIFIKDRFETLETKVSSCDLVKYMRGLILMHYLSLDAWNEFMGSLTAVVEDNSIDEEIRLKRALRCFQEYHMVRTG